MLTTLAPTLAPTLASALAPALTSLLLAQVSLDAQAPKPLPSPSPLGHYTVENPTLLIIALVAAGAIAFFALNNKGKGALAMRVGAAFMLAAAAIWAAAMFITTPREKVLALTKKLVADTATANIAALDADLADSAALYSPASPNGLSKQAILNRVAAMLGPSGAAQINDYALLDAQIHLPPSGPAQVQARVRVSGQSIGPTISWWRLDAVPQGDAWVISGIRYISSNFPIPSLN